MGCVCLSFSLSAWGCNGGSEGTGPVHADSERDKDHASDSASAREDLRRREGDDPGVRV